VRVTRDDAAEIAVSERRNLERVRAGEREYWSADTLEQSVRLTTEQIERYDHEERVCAALLDRLEHQAVRHVRHAAHHHQ
jgi:hypothetical protein